jgi:hypothetical protein
MLRRGLGPIAVAGAALALAACGSSSGDATSLLHQTFTGSHRINSGQLAFELVLTPSGSSTLKGPITLSFGGPFQSMGAGRLPQSAFNVGVGAMGANTSVTIISTGTHGYVTFQGSSYELPKATFQQLEQSFLRLGTSPSASTGSGLLGKLGIQPEHWLVNPQVVGDEAIGGVDTTHIRAGINVAALLADFNTFLRRASSLGVSGAGSFPKGISAASRERIASEVQNPSFDVWTGKSDKTIRRLAVKLTLPVSGQTSSLLGGLRSAGIGLTLQYAELNQAQTITAPTALQPYSQFQSKLRVLLSGLGGVSGALSGGSGGTVSPGGFSGNFFGGSGGSTTSNYQRYSACIQSAAGNVAKMQRCAPLLNGK